MDKGKKRRIAYEIMILMGVLLLIAHVTRIWPAVPLMLLGILACAFRVLSLSFNKEAPLETARPLAPLGEPDLENEQAIIGRAFRLLQLRVTESLMARYPGARWVWYTAGAMDLFAHGEELIIMLNGAGGFAKAKIIFNNLIFCGIEYIGPESTLRQSMPAGPEASRTPGIDAADEDAGGYEGPDEGLLPINYERLAFDWIGSRLSAINMKANEAIAKKEKNIFFPSEELPHPDSWPDVCEELMRNGFAAAGISEGGINVKLP